MRILMLGGSGLLGSSFIRHSPIEHQIIIGVRQQIYQNDVCVQVIDYSSLGAIIASIKKAKPDIVINLVALADVRSCENNPSEAFAVNSILAKNIAIATKLLAVSLVHISTDMLYDGNQAFYDESTRPSPINIYGQSKYYAEHLVLREDPKALIIRCNFFCLGTKNKSSYSDYILNAARSNEKIKIYDDVYFTPIHTKVLYSALIFLVKRSLRGVYNIASTSSLSKYKFATILLEAFGFDPIVVSPISYHLSKESSIPRPKNMSLGINKMLRQGSGLDFSIQGQIDCLRAEYDRDN